MYLLRICVPVYYATLCPENLEIELSCKALHIVFACLTSTHQSFRSDVLLRICMFWCTIQWLVFNIVLLFTMNITLLCRPLILRWLRFSPLHVVFRLSSFDLFFTDHKFIKMSASSLRCLHMKFIDVREFCLICVNIYFG